MAKKKEELVEEMEQKAVEKQDTVAEQEIENAPEAAEAVPVEEKTEEPKEALEEVPALQIPEEMPVFYVKATEAEILIRSTPEFLADNSNVIGVLHTEPGTDEVIPIIKSETGYGKLKTISPMVEGGWIQLAFTKRVE